MIDPELVARRASEIREALSKAKKFVSGDAEVFFSDERNVFTLKYLVIYAVEGAVSICMHIASKGLGETPSSYTECIDVLERNNVITSDVSRMLKAYVRLRNILIHRYWEVDDWRLFTEVKSEGFKVFEKFLEQVEQYVRKVVQGKELK